MPSIHPQPHKHLEIRNSNSLLGFLLAFFSLTAIYVGLLQSGALRWPFRRMPDLRGTYENLLMYIPFFLAAIASLRFLTIVEPPRPHQTHQRQRPSGLFWVGLSISIGYAAFLFLSTRFHIRGVMFWPPVILLSLLNALSEEVVFRLVLYRLLRNAIRRTSVSNLLQACLYAVIHFPIGGIKFAALAFCYGLLLGALVEKEDRVIPCVICHFCIDIGSIGLPLMIELPPNAYLRG